MLDSTGLPAVEKDRTANSRTHARYARVVTLSGKLGDDVKSYQERQVKRAIEEVQK
jgi:hypothetical protein